MKYIKCQSCAAMVSYENSDVELGGYPHIQCPRCGNWISLI